VASDPRRVNLDHILPKNPSAEWNDTMESIKSVEEDVVDYTYRIGNTVLVSAPMHKGLGARSFQEKKEKLFLKEENIKYTRMVADYSKWMREDIEDRQQKLANVAKLIWQIDEKSYGE